MRELFRMNGVGEWDTHSAGGMRQLEPHWNGALIAASIAISLLGAFTSTQLMCQARISRYLSGIIVWISLSSLTFGFCSIWCLHFVAMLACELDLRIGLNVGLTILSAFLAVFFTFFALASDILWETCGRRRWKRRSAGKSADSKGPAGSRRLLRSNLPFSTPQLEEPEEEEERLLARHARIPQQRVDSVALSPTAMISEPEDLPPWMNDTNENLQIESTPARPSTPEARLPGSPGTRSEHSTPQSHSSRSLFKKPLFTVADPDNMSMDDYGRSDSLENTSTSGEYSVDQTESSQSSTIAISTSDSSAFSLGGFDSIRIRNTQSFANLNPFVATWKALWAGLTFSNIVKGLLWSLAITSMHYSGIQALQIPRGRCVLSPGYVVLSALISWIVCSVGSILMAQMEIHLGQQLLFSVVATTGVAAMHFTGMKAASFKSYQPPSNEKERGYPTELPVAIGTIAIVTCLAANGLLAHSATIARNKLAEVVRTRKKMWAAIAQKENAEAAAIARTEFIASASHEIRTPLHQLQGYSDLLSRTKLTEEGRLLLYAMQDATRTLSLITSNVLDWSRLEKGEAVCRPRALDVRGVCESIMNLLPNKEEGVDVELLVAVSPNVPHSVLVDETYMHRIVMNLVSNSLKFTASGYVFLCINMHESRLLITITDTGVGIPTSFLPDLFEPFKQAQTRGAHRGTGLGLSIVKQLLQNIQGTINVESMFKDDPGVGSDRSGSCFTITVPVQLAGQNGVSPAIQQTRSTLALFSSHIPRFTSGLRAAWDVYGVDVHPVSDISDILPEWKYVWVDIPYLKKHEELIQQLSEQSDWIVLVPFDSETALYETLGTSPASQFLPVQTPLMFHRILETINLTSENRAAGDNMPRMVRFAPQVDVIDKGKETPHQRSASPPLVASSSLPDLKLRSGTVLLVEDNKINQKLGTKMLKTLGYEVLLADDGQHAIDMVTEHDTAIDIILMDQSMPRKDGLSATREIRELEANGTLRGPFGRQSSRRRPIIAVTAVVGPKAEAMCRAAGTDTFLAKPLSLARLRDMLEKFMDRGASTTETLESSHSSPGHRERVGLQIDTE